MRLAVAAAASLAALVVGVAPAGATNECKGLQVCVRVPGPHRLHAGVGQGRAAKRNATAKTSRDMTPPSVEN